ncbi:MAG: histidine kinase [bacterium]|nr:histidine kinase [bacterium]
MSHISIQLKLIMAFLLTSTIIGIVNGVIFYNINLSVSKVDEVYKSNVSMNQFTDALSNVDLTFREYLETKSSASMDSYYRNVQEVEQYLNTMDTTSLETDSLMMLQDISNLTHHYIDVTAEGITAKRGRNAEKYRNKYNESKQELKTINTFIYSLNNQQFQVNSKNYDALVKTLRYLELICIFLIICVTIINLILISILTRKITKPLILLAKTADEVGKGNLLVPFIETTTKDEVGIVANAFNQMTLQLQNYIAQIREGIQKENAYKEKELLMENHLKDVQLKYLQAQINPHFLFNTLNAGVQLAMMEDAEQTSTYIQNMADFFRYNLKKIDTDTTLQQELLLVDHYLYILNVRFSGEIHYEKQIDEQYTMIRVPSMILQPLIENSVNHGIRNMEGKGLIKLTIYADNMYVCISVKDNGEGMDKRKIEELLEMKEVTAKKDDSNGIGLINVMKRLSLYYHGQNIVEIKSDGKNTGTEIILYIPILM